jgi:hypothetical protein
MSRAHSSRWIKSLPFALARAITNIALRFVTMRPSTKGSQFFQTLYSILLRVNAWWRLGGRQNRGMRYSVERGYRRRRNQRTIVVGWKVACGMLADLCSTASVVVLELPKGVPRGSGISGCAFIPPLLINP